MTITKLQDKYLAEIDKLRTILDDENIDNNTQNQKDDLLISHYTKTMNIELLLLPR